MNFLYTLAIRFVACMLPLLAVFNRKIRLFYKGRRESFRILQTQIGADDQVIWLHAASLGEYEQGLPILKRLRELYPEKKLVITFFSPSGYEAKKHSKEADVILYLPLDLPRRVNRFLHLLHPQMAIFVKYEFWPNYLLALKDRGIPTYLVSGVFRKDQLFFKKRSWGMRAVLPCFTHFFVQNESAKLLLQSIGITNITVSGDTRFDRVMEILSRDNKLPFVERFLSGAPCMVFGSSWREDEQVYIPFLNAYKGNMKFIIAPHEVHDKEKIHALRDSLRKHVAILSEVEGKDLSPYEVLIVDKIGLLTKIYSYAAIAYVGGGMGNKGLHNILEPAVFSIPVVIGKNYDKFNEAKELIRREGVFSIKNTEEFTQIATFLFTDVIQRKKAGILNYNYIVSNTGATEKFISMINANND